METRIDIDKVVGQKPLRIIVDFKGDMVYFDFEDYTLCFYKMNYYKTEEAKCKLVELRGDLKILSKYPLLEVFKREISVDEKSTVIEYEAVTQVGKIVFKWLYEFDELTDNAYKVDDFIEDKTGTHSLIKDQEGQFIIMETGQIFKLVL